MTAYWVAWGLFGISLGLFEWLSRGSHGYGGIILALIAYGATATGAVILAIKLLILLFRGVTR